MSRSYWVLLCPEWFYLWWVGVSVCMLVMYVSIAYDCLRACVCMSACPRHFASDCPRFPAPGDECGDTWQVDLKLEMSQCT